ncbi:MAG: hypothetical protein Q7T16_02865 [Candidatus Burarchaeum sp.]|nr:hypothetical protein [Candidatus Burarchaeum sp.]
MEINSTSISDARYARLSTVLSEAIADVNTAANGGDRTAERSASDCLQSANNDLNYVVSYLIKMMQDVTGLKEERSFEMLRTAVRTCADTGNQDAIKIMSAGLVKRDELVTAIHGVDALFVPNVAQSIVEKPAVVHSKPAKVAREKSLPVLMVIGDWYHNLKSTQKKLGFSGVVFSMRDNAGKFVRKLLERLPEENQPLQKVNMNVAKESKDSIYGKTMPLYIYNPNKDCDHYTGKTRTGENVVVKNNDPFFSALESQRLLVLDKKQLRAKEPLFKHWSKAFTFNRFDKRLQEIQAERAAKAKKIQDALLLRQVQRTQPQRVWIY